MLWRSVRIMVKVCSLAVLLGGLLISPALAANEINSSDVFDFTTGVQLPGSAMLVRSEAGVTFTLQEGSGIPANAPVTIWMVVWNNPENCTRLSEDGVTVFPFCNDTDFAQDFDGDPSTNVNVVLLGPVAGHVVGPNGKGNFAGHLDIGDASGSINDLLDLPFQGGLEDAFGAEIHLIVHVHPTDLGDSTVAHAIHSFEGGCATADDPPCDDVAFAFFVK